MTKVMATGTFDLLHKGHLNYLEQCKKQGDELIVVIATDKTVEKEKGELPHWNQEKRKQELEKTGLADTVSIGNEGDKLKIVEQESPDIICLGYDQEYNEEKIKTTLKERGITVEIKRMQSFHPEKYKTTILKQKTQ